MYIDYIRTLISVTEMGERRKASMAARLEEWAKKNEVKDLAVLHEEFDSWINGQPQSINGRKVVSLEKPIGEDSRLVELVQEPNTQTPPEILIAGSENMMTAAELQQFISEDSPDLAPASSIILGTKPEAVYREDDLDPQQIHQRLTAIIPRVRNGKFMVPDKQVVSIGFVGGQLEIRYRRGYSDERVQKVIECRLAGMTYAQVAESAGVSFGTVSRWAQHMGLTKPVREYTEKEKVREDVVEFVRSFFREHKIGPIQKQVTEATGYSGANVYAAAGRAGLKKLKLYTRIPNKGGLQVMYLPPEASVDNAVFGSMGLSLEPRCLDIEPPYKQAKRASLTHNPIQTERLRRRQEVRSFFASYQETNGRGPTTGEIKNTLLFNPYEIMLEFVGREIIERRTSMEDGKLRIRYFLKSTG